MWHRPNEGLGMWVEVGDPAPDFSLPDQIGDLWTLSAHRGAPVVVYFCPGTTQECVTQACVVRDAWLEFLSRGASVVGISPRDAETLAALPREHELPHRLLADPDGGVIRAYGAWEPTQSGGDVVTDVARSSVVIDPEGIVAEVFPTIEPHEQAAVTLEVISETM